MIERHYFMHIRKLHSDGSGSYSYHYSLFSRRSWFPEPAAAFEEQLDYIKNEMREAIGDRIEVTAFNRC